MEGHVYNRTLVQCATLADENKAPYFGLENPACCPVPGDAMCLLMTEAPVGSDTKLNDTECAGENLFAGYHLGAFDAIAVYGVALTTTTTPAPAVECTCNKDEKRNYTCGTDPVQKTCAEDFECSGPKMSGDATICKKAEGGFPAWAIALIVIGAIAILGGGGAAAYMCSQGGDKGSSKKKAKRGGVRAVKRAGGADEEEDEESVVDETQAMMPKTDAGAGGPKATMLVPVPATVSTGSRTMMQPATVSTAYYQQPAYAVRQQPAYTAVQQQAAYTTVQQPTMVQSAPTVSSTVMQANPTMVLSGQPSAYYQQGQAMVQ